MRSDGEKNARNRSARRVIWLLAAAFLLAGLLSVCFGSTFLSPVALSRAIRAGDLQAPEVRILVYVRLPRTVGALLCGAALALSGALLQVLMNNPLAGPSIIGVNAGAGFGTLLTLALLPAGVLVQPIGAFLGALGCTLLVYGMARLTGASRTAVVLSGVAVSGIVTALSSALRMLFPDILSAYNSFTVGTLNGVKWQQLVIAAAPILIGCAAALLLGRRLDLLTLGEESAGALGLYIGRLRFGLILLSSLLAATAVSVAGSVGFLGLLVPHAARALVGSRHRHLLPACLLLGGTAMALCDLLGRVLLAPFEMPVGILLSVVGGGYFLWLLWKQKGGKA